MGHELVVEKGNVLTFAHPEVFLTENMRKLTLQLFFINPCLVAIGNYILVSFISKYIFSENLNIILAVDIRMVFSVNLLQVKMI